MKITISCSYGTWRPVYLASQLDKMGYLQRLYVPYYKHKIPYNYLWKYFKLGKSKEIYVDPDRVRTNILHTILNEPIRGGSLPTSISLKVNYLVGEIADRSVARDLDDSGEIVIAESNFALHTIEKAKSLGVISIVDRTNSHIEYQKRLLIEEYGKFGLRYPYNEERVKKGVREYEEADYIFVLSSFVKRTFLEMGIDEEKIFLIPSGVNISQFRKIDKEDDVFRIIYCGGLSLKKGVQYLLKAFSELKLKDAELWLIGSISREIKPLLKKYEGHYKLIGYVPNHLLYKHYSQGSIFVLPSIEEGMAKVTIEAMACGLPVIATTNTGAEDIVRNNLDGFIINIRDVEALKEKINYMYENPGRVKEMSQNATKRVREGFTWADYANRVVKVCKKILNKNM